MNEQQQKCISNYSNFLSETKQFFEDINEGMQKDNHKQHDIEPNYKGILLKEIVENPEYWDNKTALDFGCGCGRNIKNLLDLANFKTVDGCDISYKNIEYSKKYIDDIFKYSSKCYTWEIDGATLYPCENNTYDFIMSHQVFQHIANYEVRYSLLSDIYRTLKPGGLISLHYMNLGSSLPYYSNNNTATVYSIMNATTENPKQVIDDLNKIGFKNVTCTESKDYYHGRNEFYFKGTK